MCPHICEEAWEILGNKQSISDSPWPKVDLEYWIRLGIVEFINS